MSADRETISGRVEGHDAVPARYRGGDGESERIRIVSRDRLTGDHEELTGDEFHDELECNDEVDGDARSEHDEPLVVTDRDVVIQESSLEDEAVEEALLGGETVTTEITETTVVEREMDLEGVQQNALGSGLVEVDASTAELVGNGSVESERAEDDAVHFYLLVRETVEEEVDLEKHYARDVTGETTYVDPHPR